MKKVLDPEDIILEAWCNHRHKKRDWMEDPKFYEPNSCPYCLGTNYEVTPFGLKVLEFVKRHQDFYLFSKEGEAARLFNGTWVREEDLPQ